MVVEVDNVRTSKTITKLGINCLNRLDNFLDPFSHFRKHFGRNLKGVGQIDS